ncbi:MAG: 2-dehydropantoate 2-reductase [Acidimicrobiales bacterium]
MKVAVLGPGGVGGLLAGVLARHRDAVVCIASTSTCEQLRTAGISVRSQLLGDFTVNVDATSTLQAPIDVCLITVKATQLETALERVPRGALGDALVVPLLNGIEHLDLLRERYGASVVPATIRVESTRSAPGKIESASPFITVELGLPIETEAVQSQRIRAFGAHLIAAGVDTEIRDDVQTMMWGKLSFLAPVALLTTHESAPVGDIRTTFRTDLLTLVDEVVAVAQKDGARVEAQSIVRLLDSVPDAMRSSMQRDAAAGRGIEIDAIGGAILRAAKRLDVAVPLATKLVKDLSRNPGRRGGEQRH